MHNKYMKLTHRLTLVYIFTTQNDYHKRLSSRFNVTLQKNKLYIQQYKSSYIGNNFANCGSNYISITKKETQIYLLFPNFQHKRICRILYKSISRHHCCCNLLKLKFTLINSQIIAVLYENNFGT